MFSRLRKFSPFFSRLPASFAHLFACFCGFTRVFAIFIKVCACFYEFSAWYGDRIEKEGLPRFTRSSSFWTYSHFVLNASCFLRRSFRRKKEPKPTKTEHTDGRKNRIHKVQNFAEICRISLHVFFSANAPVYLRYREFGSAEFLLFFMCRRGGGRLLF